MATDEASLEVEARREESDVQEERPKDQECSEGSPESVEAEAEKKSRRRRSSEHEDASVSTDRPVRERKSVERFGSSTPKVAPVGISIKKGPGEQLKNIPNVAFKLSKRKVNENLQILHTILFGKKSKQHFVKRNILQFSGYVWSDNEDKQKAKVKEKIEKYPKDKLLDFCDMLDIPPFKSGTKKEEVVVKVFEFLESPHVTRDVLLAEKEQARTAKKRNRKAGVRKSMPSNGRKRYKSTDAKELQVISSKAESQSEGEADGTGEEALFDEENDEFVKEESNQVSSEDEKKPKVKKRAAKRARGSSKRHPSESFSDKDSLSCEEEDMIKSDSMKNQLNGDDHSDEDRELTGIKMSSSRDSLGTVTGVKSKGKASSARKSRTHAHALEGTNDKQKKGKEKEKKINASTQSRRNRKKVAKVVEKASSNKEGKIRSGSKVKELTREEMHAVVAEMLKKVDFNTVTLSDIVRQLGEHFKMDLSDRKLEVKGVIQQVIDEMSDDEGDDNAETVEPDEGKEEVEKEPVKVPDAMSGKAEDATETVENQVEDMAEEEEG